MVAKTDPDEKVGVFVRAASGSGPDKAPDKTQVVEYSDLPEALARERAGGGDGDGGPLRFCAGSIAIHMLGLGFVERLTADARHFALPYHRAVKKTSFIDAESGRAVVPDRPNAVKLETFVFDALPLAESSIVVETDRLEEFAPIKNADGADSPATSHALQIDRAARWLEANGVVVPRDESGRVTARIEISPLTALDPGDLASVELPARVEPGEELVL